MLINRPRAREWMQRERLDALVATSPENVTYMTDFWSMSQWIRRGPQTYALYPAEGRGEPCLVVSTGALDLVADQEPWVTDVRRYGYFVLEQAPGVSLEGLDARLAAHMTAEDDGDVVVSLVRAITERGLEGGRIGVDELGILPAYLEKLRAALPKATLVPAWETFRQIRAVKTPEEVRRLRAAAQIAEQSIAAALRAARVGATEIELATAFHAETIRAGAQPVLGVIGTGPRSALANAQPSGRRLEPGDVIRFDVGGRYRYYRADIARIATLGEPPAKVRQYHHALRAGMNAAIDAIRPGARASEVFRVGMERARREGMSHYQRNHVGHGIGLDGYDVPNLTPSSQEVLEEGMVLSVETPYYELGFAGLQVEDMIVVTRDGVERLMATSSELQVL